MGTGLIVRNAVGDDVFKWCLRDKTRFTTGCATGFVVYTQLALLWSMFLLSWQLSVSRKDWTERA